MPKRFSKDQSGTVQQLNDMQDSITANLHGGPGVLVRRQTGSRSVGISQIDDRIIPASGGSGGGGMIEVAIDKIVNCAVPFDDEEVTTCLNVGNRNHFKTFRVNADGQVVVADAYTPVFPNHGHTVFAYAQVAWDAFDPAQPTFSAIKSDRGYTMTFNEGESLVPPPIVVCGDAPAGVECCHPSGSCTSEDSADACTDQGGTVMQNCAANCGDPQEPGFCCLGPGNCQSMESIKDCTAVVGEWFTTPEACEGSSCFDGSPGMGACCHLDNTCQDDTMAALCKGDNGVYQGDGSICTPGLCDAKDPAGICCFGGGSCVDTTDPKTCLGIGGEWQPGGSCPCEMFLGCCCLAGACAPDIQNSVCMNASGIWFMFDNAACDACNASCG